MKAAPTVFIVDDDEHTRESLANVIGSAGWRVVACRSAEEFLGTDIAASDAPQCLIADLRMTGLSGLGLQERLLRDGMQIPIIFLTGHGTVQAAVQALKGGAVDFIEKPVHRQTLLDCIEQALNLDAQARERRREAESLRGHLSSLTQRERDVLTLLLAGKNNKQISAALDIGIPTVTKHRKRVLRKLDVSNVVELVRLAATSELEPSQVAGGPVSDRLLPSIVADPS